MYFRLDDDIVDHKRVVFTFTDFIEVLGGVPGFVIQIAQFVYGGYAAFHSALITAHALAEMKKTQKNSGVDKICLSDQT